MMKRHSSIIVLTSIAVGLSMVLSGCGWLFDIKDLGPLTTREFELTGFNAVDIGSAFKADITQSDEYSVQITSNENVFNNIVVEKIGNTLKIGLKWPGISFGNRTLEASITMPELESLSISGSSRGNVTGFKSGNDFETNVSGASDLNLDIEAGTITAIVSGSSEVDARMVSRETYVQVTGASDLIIDLKTGPFRCECSGSSEVTGVVDAMETKLSLSGASRIELDGSGGDLDLSGSGSSNFSLLEYSIENLNVNLSGASRATLDINGEVKGTISGASVLLYEGHPILGNTLDISGGSRFEHR